MRVATKLRSIASRFIVAIVGVIAFGYLLFLMSNTRWEVDIASGRARHSVYITYLLIYRTVEDTSFSRLAAADSDPVEPEWRIDSEKLFGGPHRHFRHHGALSSLGNLAWLIEHEQLSSEQRSTLIQAALAAMQREEAFDVYGALGKEIEIVGSDGTVLSTITID